MKQKAKDRNFTHFYNSQLTHSNFIVMPNYTKCMILFKKLYKYTCIQYVFYNEKLYKDNKMAFLLYFLCKIPAIKQ